MIEMNLSKKNTYADLESRRPLFFSIGLVIALFIVIILFEVRFPVHRVQLKAKEIVWENDLLELLPDVLNKQTHEPPKPSQSTTAANAGKRATRKSESKEPLTVAEQGIYYMKIPDMQSLVTGGEIEVMFHKDSEIKERIQQGKVARNVVFRQVVHGRNAQGEWMVDKKLWNLIEGNGNLHLDHHTSMVRVHEKFAVNLNQVSLVEPDRVLLKDGTEIPLDSQYIANLREQVRFYESFHPGGTIAVNIDHAMAPELAGFNSSASTGKVSDQVAGKVSRRRRNKIIFPREIPEVEKPWDWYIERPYGHADYTVRVRDHMRMGPSNAISVLAGRAAGVYVKGNDISIRGGGTPLFMLNGMPVPKEVILRIPMNDIAAIDILKSPLTTTFYGSRGAHGVIVVYTRSPLEED